MRGLSTYPLLLATALALGASACAEDPAPASCEADLIDLDGDGTVDADDCALREEGRFYRAICAADASLWQRSRFCSATTITPLLEGRAGITTEPGTPEFLVTTDDTLHLYTLLSPSSPLRESVLPLPRRPDSAFYWIAGERLAATTAREAWLDLDGERDLDANEILLLDEIFGDRVFEPRFATDAAGRAIVAAKVNTGQLVIWLDRDRDGHGAPGEFVEVDSRDPVIGFIGAQVIYRRQSDGAVRTWTGTADAWVFDPAQTFASSVHPSCAQLLGRGCWTTVGTVRRYAQIGFDGACAVPSGHRVSLFGSWIVTQGNTAGWSDDNYDCVIQDDEFIEVRLQQENDWSLGFGAFVRAGEVTGGVWGIFNRSYFGGGPEDVVSVYRRPATSFAGETCSPTKPCADNLQCTSRAVCVLRTPPWI